MKPVIIIAIAFVLLIPVGIAQAELDIDKKSIFSDKKFDVTTKLTNHNGIPFNFVFYRDFSESENDAYYELYKIIDSRTNQHVGDLRIYLGSSQWWNANAFLQEKDTSGFSNIIKIKLFVIHMTDPSKIDDVSISLAYALKTLVPEWSEKTSSVSSDNWFSDSINNAERNDENKREDSIIIEDKEITVFHDDIDFGSITIIVTENLDVTYSNYVSEKDEFLEEILDLPESEELGIASFVDKSKDPQYYVDRYNNEITYRDWFDKNYPDITIYQAVGLPKPEPTPESEPEPVCKEGFELFNGICYRNHPSVDHTLLPYYEEDDAGSLRDSIRYFHQNWEFEKALELTEEAKKYSDEPIYSSILLEKYHILAKMSRHQEALDTFNEFDKMLDSGYNIWNWQKGTTLYILGEYSSSVEVLESTLVEIQEKETIPQQKKFLTGLAMFTLGMTYEQLGNLELSDQAYARASQDIVIRNLDCNKVSSLIGFGGYVEAMEILNNMDSEIKCISGSEEDTVQSLKSLTQERINKYQSNSSVKTVSSICGTGTIEKNGQCVPEHETMVTEMQQKSSKGGGCLIATATYGSELAPQVQQLRELRDNKLLNTESGSAFLSVFNDFYYSFSPYIADYERENPVFREMVKIAITPMISSLSILNYVDMDSEVEVLGYGISLIILNVGMYVGIPASVIMIYRKHKPQFDMI